MFTLHSEVLTSLSEVSRRRLRLWMCRKKRKHEKKKTRNTADIVDPMCSVILKVINNKRSEVFVDLIVCN